MHTKINIVQFIYDFFFSFNKTPYLCTAKIETNLYITN
jgi:hypothetical protein